MRILTWRLVGLEHFDLHTSTAGHAGAASGQIFAKVWWWLRGSSAPSLPQVRKTIIEAFGDGLASVPCSVESHDKTTCCRGGTVGGASSSADAGLDRSREELRTVLWFPQKAFTGFLTHFA